jgi:uncharacterized protein YdaU (DUF1376 family)
MSGAIPYFGDAYMADTRHLTLEEHGAYHLLLLIAWRSPNCALPNDDKRISQMLGITAKKWSSLKPAVLGFWTLTENGWEQKRLTKERRWVDEKSRKNKAAADARWEDKPLKTNDADDANASANGEPDGPANGNAPLPPPQKSSEANASGGSPPADPVKQMWDLGVEILTSTGVPERQARSQLGKWSKGGKEAQVLQGLIESRGKASPMEWLEKRLAGSKYTSDSGYEYRGDERAVMREAEKRADWGVYWQAKANLEGERQTANG